MSKVARWCFTVNNPGSWVPAFDEETMVYLVWANERGEDGTPHVQGYVRFKTRKAMATAKRIISDRAHLETARGTEGQNRDYCNKQPLDGLHEHGTFDATAGTRGKRNDLKECLDKLKAGIPKAKVFMEHPDLIVKYPTGMEKVAEVLLGPPPPYREVHNLVLWGSTGTGKSRRALNTFPDAYRGTVGVGTFDRYSGEKEVILDEFDPCSVPIQELLQWLDIYSTQLKCRYTNKYARWTKMIIIANDPPAQWYLMEAQTRRDALLRRLSPPMGVVQIVESLDQPLDLNALLTGPPYLDQPAPSPSTPVMPVPVPHAVAPTAPAAIPTPPPTPTTATTSTHRAKRTIPHSPSPCLRKKTRPFYLDTDTEDETVRIDSETEESQSD